MKHLIVGLGNPGDTYTHTRHNIGFRVLDAVAQHENVAFSYEKKHGALVAQLPAAFFVQPQTFMNNSGQAVRSLAEYYNIPPSHIVVVFDDKDIPFGVIRVRSTGSSGGHNGVQSIIQHLGTQDFTRIRIGVQNQYMEGKDTAQFVLDPFSSDEETMLPKILEKSSQLLEQLLSGEAPLSHQDITVDIEQAD